jgi:hypothetical protein
MVSVKATDFTMNFGHYEQLARKEPVEIKSHDRPVGYLISPSDYHQFRWLQARRRQVFRVSELPGDLVEEILRSEVDARHGHLDHSVEASKHAK